MTFHVRQKVVRVNNLSGPDAISAPVKYSYPVNGEVCTVREIFESRGLTLITLAEHDNSHLIGAFGREPGFNALAFRPAVERKTDSGVAILKKIARDVTERRPVKITERA